jgi:cystathionine beta-lyase/cystathionine gamma-synthase
MGALVVKDKDLAEKLYFLQNASGAVCGPMDSFLVLRGLKTLHVRMQRHCENGAQIAEYLKNHPKVDKVYWPGFETHPNPRNSQEADERFWGHDEFYRKRQSKIGCY